MSSYYSKGDKPDEVYLNLVLEFVPETIYRIIKHYGETQRVRETKWEGGVRGWGRGGEGLVLMCRS